MNRYKLSSDTDLVVKSRDYDKIFKANHNITDEQAKSQAEKVKEKFGDMAIFYLKPSGAVAVKKYTEAMREEAEKAMRERIEKALDRRKKIKKVAKFLLKLVKERRADDPTLLE